MRAKVIELATLSVELRIPMRGYEGIERAELVAGVKVTNPHEGL